MTESSSELLRHPAADALIERGVVHYDPAHMLELTPLRAGLLVLAANANRRVLLHTSVAARVSPALVAALRDVCGRWIVEDASGGLCDALSGERVNPADPLAPPSEQDADVLQSVRRVDATEILLAASIRHRASVAPSYAVLLERFTTALGAAPSTYGPHEPPDRPWSRDALTADLRLLDWSRRLFIHGDADHVMRGSVFARATDKGVEEVIDAAVALPLDADDVAARVQSALVVQAEREFTLFAVVLARAGHVDLMRRPGRPAAAAPLAVLIGPPALRDLGADIDQLVELFGAVRVGRPGTPSFLLPLRGDVSDWRTLAQVADVLGRDRVEAVLGRPLPASPAG